MNVGAYSGLETDRSDFVGMVGVASPRGLSGSLGGRFDELTFEMRRLQAKAGYSTTPFSVEGQYTFIRLSPLRFPL